MRRKQSCRLAFYPAKQEKIKHSVPLHGRASHTRPRLLRPPPKRPRQVFTAPAGNILNGHFPGLAKTYSSDLPVGGQSGLLTGILVARPGPAYREPQEGDGGMTTQFGPRRTEVFGVRRQSRATMASTSSQATSRGVAEPRLPPTLVVLRAARTCQDLQFQFP